MNEITAGELSALLKGNLEGNAEIIISDVAKIETATSGSVSFLANTKYEKFIYTTEASVVVVSHDFVAEKSIIPALIRVEDPYSSFSRILRLFSGTVKAKTGIEQPAFVAASAQIGRDSYIGAFSYISEQCEIGKEVKIYPGVYLGENCRIGDKTIIYPNVSIYPSCQIGGSCIIHSGAVIGSDGFGFVPQQGGDFNKIPQTGIVIVEDEVEIGANTTIDRATMGSTIIKQGSKLDNLIQVAHNVEIGENTVIAAQAGISGSSKLGAYCMIGGQAGIIGHLEIADQTRIGAQSGISKSISKEGSAVLDSPAFEYKKALRSRAVFRQLPEMLKRLEELEKEISLLREKLD